MVDFIFGVSHPDHWHALNMQQNPHHYSGIRRLGSGAVTMLQEKVGAGIYFNPYVTINGMVSYHYYYHYHMT
jgi:translocator assembly and maintenance protein 41